ncbi:MAG: chemotaxis protein CheR [Treponema sp.]|nr:chemotaxis protein CheR [Treponema sp.]
MSDVEFKTISSYIEKKVGIKMPEEKKLMIQSRLTSRLKALRMSSFKEYIDYVFSSDSNDEIVTMIDVLTTNLTHFFREKEHFNVLVKTVLPSLVHAGVTVPQLWSAGCSTGEEPYTLSMVMNKYMRKRPGKIENYDILATDISTRVLSRASNAVYPLESVENLPYEIKKLYFLKSKAHVDNPSVRVKQDIRAKVKFQRINFMDPSYNVGMKDIIFCRNVLIYFEKKIQEEVIRKLLRNLNKGGFLFLGHSETIFGMDLPVETIAPTVFRKV